MFDSISGEERGYYEGFELEWRKQIQHYTFYDLLAIFPSAKSAIRRNLLLQIKEAQEDLEKALEADRQFNTEFLSKAKYEERWFFEKLRDTFVSGPLRHNREKLIKRNRFYLSALKPQKVHESQNITPENIAYAKTIPIDSLIEVGRNGFAVSPFHSDKTPSLRAYLDTNRWYCFSCNAGTDTIDLVMKLNGCNFVEAVRILLKK